MDKEELLRTSHQLSGLLLNLSADPDSFVEHHECRRDALFELLADLSVKVDRGLEEVLNG